MTQQEQWYYSASPELRELTDGKNLKELRAEYCYQVETNGETDSGNICSHIQCAIAILKTKSL